MAEAADQRDVRVTVQELAARRGQSPQVVQAQVVMLQREGLLRHAGGRYGLTERGLDAAYGVVRNHRLWEMFLMHEGQLGADHVDRDADFIEHHLDRETVEELERLLRVHGRELELPPSVHPLAA